MDAAHNEHTTSIVPIPCLGISVKVGFRVMLAFVDAVVSKFVGFLAQFLWVVRKCPSRPQWRHMTAFVFLELSLVKIIRVSSTIPTSGPNMTFSSTKRASDNQWGINWVHGTLSVSGSTMALYSTETNNDYSTIKLYECYFV
ncbi:hypothetical protein BD408DRAFT_4825 [Parasitella parasitica]|nr:hypothetical protein BD408DRAFT_4825 [Parasitella parasitica]